MAESGRLLDRSPRGRVPNIGGQVRLRGGYDGNIYYYRDGNTNSFTFQGQLALGTTGTVQAVTPPQTFAVDSDCFNLFVNGSDEHIWVDQICSDITLPSPMASSNGAAARLLVSPNPKTLEDR